MPLISEPLPKESSTFFAFSLVFLLRSTAHIYQAQLGPSVYPLLKSALSQLVAQCQGLKWETCLLLAPLPVLHPPLFPSFPAALTPLFSPTLSPEPSGRSHGVFAGTLRGAQKS